jgi:hypothetical protein
MAKEYIDRSFVEYLIKFYGGMVTWTRKDVVNEFVKRIQAEPTADVVEVVRCRDCKYATLYSCKNDACYKGIICEYRIGTGDENFFCSYGERKEDNG